MKRFLCIHGHFYQPPRENPWLDEIEVQDSAMPFHDWNEKILIECYAPNAASRIVDGQNRIIEIFNNYAKISFNFGPTLLSWIQKHANPVFQAILDADQLSIRERNGHGNAIAQVYNHIIMPLATRRDKWIQIQWGIRDFQIRFKRSPEGMWLSETAVDLETLELMAEAGIKFTILAPNQALRIKKITSNEWMDVRGGKIDPTLPYRCFLGNGHHIDIFFYDGPISNSIAFEKALKSSKSFTERLMAGFWDERVWDQILSVATDGESYGHHYKFGEMTLAHTLSHVKNYNVELINYGEYLERYPPNFQVEIIENTSWSCAHGIERWRRDCGCNSGKMPHWDQAWRAPLRQGLNYIKENLDAIFEREMEKFVNNPWDVLIDYVDLIVDRSKERQEKFFERYKIRDIEDSKKVLILKLFEMERFSQLMFTSCGWFFDDISGIEPVQLLKYAARAIQLASPFLEEDIEEDFMEMLAKAKSNIPYKGTGKEIYQNEVLPLKLDLMKVLRHYAVSSMFENYEPHQKIYCYNIWVEDFKRGFKDGKGLAMGKVRITDQITQETLEAQFGVLSTKELDFLIYTKAYPFKDDFLKTLKYHFWRFNCGKIEEVKKSLGEKFQMHSLSLKDIFLDERRKIAKLMSEHIFKDFENTYKRIYDDYKTIMEHLTDMDIPMPYGFKVAAQYYLTGELDDKIKGLVNGKKTKSDIMDIIDQSNKLKICFDQTPINESITKSLVSAFKKMMANPFNKNIFYIINTLLDITEKLKLNIELWYIQNLFYAFYNKGLSSFPYDKVQESIQDFKELGKRLNFVIS